MKVACCLAPVITLFVSRVSLLRSPCEGFWTEHRDAQKPRQEKLEQHRHLPKTGTFKSMVIYPSSVMICSFALTASLGVFATFVVVVANNVVVYYDDDDDDE